MCVCLSADCAHSVFLDRVVEDCSLDRGWCVRKSSESCAAHTEDEGRTGAVLDVKWICVSPTVLGCL